MEEISVTEAAEKLGKTDRTIRNYIKEGRIKARHVENQFGWEYRIYDLGEFASTESQPEKEAETRQLPAVENQAETALQIVTRENLRLWEEYKQLREANNRLAYDLGARDQRIKDLERELEEAHKATAGNPQAENTAAKQETHRKPWWKKIWGTH
jgi:excisionase family DNA binding protein